MIAIKTDFPFKPKRDYVHGTDIYNFLIAQLKDKFYLENFSLCSHFSIMFLKPLNHNGELLLLNTSDTFDAALMNRVRVRGRVKIKDETVNFILIEDDKSQVVHQIEYDETLIESKCIYQNNKVSLYCSELNYSNIELLIPMFKLILKKETTYNGKWLFTRLDLDQMFDLKNLKQLAIEKYDFSNPKLVIGTLSSELGKVGRIYFSLT